MASYLEIAKRVLLAARTPLSARDILERAYLADLVPKHLYGKTQHKTLQARLSEDILNNRDRSLFFRTDPGRFFLRQFLQDASIPEEFKTEFPARRRIRDLQTTGVLSLETKSLAEDSNSCQVIDPQRVFKLLRTNRFHYSTSLDEYSTYDCALVFSFVMVCRNDEVLSYRGGRFHTISDTFFNKRSIGFSFPVTDNDASLFDPSDYGIKLSGLKGVTEDLGISRDLNRPHENNGDAQLGGFVLHANERSECRLLAVVRYECPEWFEPTKRRLALNDLRWMRLEERVNDLYDFDPWSRSILSSQRLTQRMI
jgi:hypothetical protein